MAFRRDWVLPNLYVTVGFVVGVAAGRLLTSFAGEEWSASFFLGSLGLSIKIDGDFDVDSPAAVVSPYFRKYFLLLAARLLDGHEPQWLLQRIGLPKEFLDQIRVTSSEELCACMERIARNTGLEQEVPELATNSSHVLHVGINEAITLTKPLKLLLEHYYFQRLASISQLGLVSQVYQAATHSRQDHSLGTCHNAGMIARALHSDPVNPLFRQLVSPTDVRELLLTALLHDIGQFPMAHDLEEIEPDIFDHKAITTAIVKGAWAPKKGGARTIRMVSLEPVFRAWKTTPERVLQILQAKPRSATASPKDKLLRSIIDGPLDADKLDYLIRDASRLEVPYPLGIDVDRILRTVTTVLIERVGDAHHVWSLGVHEKGKVPAEFVSIARYAMFTQVYWHHTVRSQKAMLARFVLALVAEFRGYKSRQTFISDFVEMVVRLPHVLYESSQIGLLFAHDLDTEAQSRATKEFEGLDRTANINECDRALLVWLGNKGRELPERELIDQLLSRSLYKRLWVISEDRSPRDFEEITETWDKLSGAHRHSFALEFEGKILRLLKTAQSAGDLPPLTAQDSQGLLDELGTRTASRLPWLLFDSPGGRPGADVGLYYVVEAQRRALRKDDRAIGDVELSTAWQDFAGNLRERAGKVRIFCLEKYADLVFEAVNRAAGLGALRDTLGSLSGVPARRRRRRRL